MGFLDSLGGIGGAGGIVSGLGALSGLFGGGDSKDYGSSGDLSAGRRYLNQENALGGQYGNLSSQAMGQYGADNGQYRSAAGNYANLLQQNPYTDQYSAAQLAQSGAGTSAAYSRARANLQANAAGMGLGGGGGSALSGGLAGIDASQAGTLSGQQNQLALQAIAQHRQNMGQLTDLYGGIAGQDYGRGTSALGAQEGVDRSLAGSYLGLGDQERNMEIGYQQQMNQATSAGLGSLGSSLGAAGGYKAAGGYGGNSGAAANAGMGAMAGLGMNMMMMGGF